MKILVLNWRDIKHPEAGGAEIHFTEIFSRLVKKGYGVTLLTTRFKGSALSETQQGIEILRWGNTYTFNWQAPFLIRKVLKEREIDCIIDDVNKLPFFSAHWFPSIPVAAFFHHLFGKTIFGLTSVPFGIYVFMMEKLCTLGYRRVPCCSVSKSTADELLTHHFSPEKMVIIENSVDTDYFSPDESVLREEDLLLYVGRLKRYKHVDLVFEAMKLLQKEGRRVRFYIAGSGDDEPFLKSRCSDLGLTERVTFAGQISEEQKLMLFRKASIFVNTSLKEGWGITNIEAAACGTAVVANDAPGLRDSVVHDKTGLLFRENDLHSFTECITEILNNPEKKRSFEKQGRQWALKFSWDVSAERVEGWIKNVVLSKQSQQQ